MQVNLSALNNFDYIISGIVFLSTLIAIVRGFIKSAISLTGWCLSILIGMKFYFLLMPMVSKYIAFEALAAACSAFVLFLISAIVLAIINNIFYMVLSVFCGGILDRSAGALFGFVRGCLLVCAGFYVVLMFMPQLHPDYKTSSKNTEVSLPIWAKTSKAIPLLVKGAKLIDECIPLDFGSKIKMILRTEERGIEKENLAKLADSSSRIESILSELPAEVLKRVPSDDLVTLQDTTAPGQNKAKILTDMKKLYEEYMHEPISNLSEAEIRQRDLSYYETMITIEDTVSEYDKLLMAPGMPSRSTS